MSRVRVLMDARNRAIKEAYGKLQSETVVSHTGKREQKYRHTAMLAILSRKFYLSEGSIQNILGTTDEEVESTQLLLPLDPPENNLLRPSATSSKGGGQA